MMLKLILAALLVLVNGAPDKRDMVIDKGDHLLVCSQEPIEFGIVLDSSSSIRHPDFAKARDFLVSFLNQFAIGNKRNDVRVSLITFGKGIFPEDGFYLDTYSDKAGVLNHLANLKHSATPYTDTGKAIQFMHEKQLNDSVARPYAEKISLVITDGNSQKWTFTRDQARLAREDNITMFALGIGSERQVGMRELLNIAGDAQYVTRVDNFDDLDAIKTVLAKKTCIKKEKPTTTPPPMIQSCGEVNPTDMEFIFSPADMGIDATAWATSFIGLTVDSDDLAEGFRYGVKSGSCPDDEGFHLDAYHTTDDIKERLSAYDRKRLPSLVGADLFSAARGGRDDARDVAVLVMSGGKGMDDLQAKVDELTARNVTVFIANAAGRPVHFDGAKALQGRSSRQQAEDLVNYLCPQQ